MNPFISVIVPIYNAENYLETCLDSLISQTLNNIEIILVDDLSTDSSRAIIKKYAKKDSRIKVIFNEKNSGVSKTRNEAIKIASGDYIGFVDSDDYVHSSMYEKMYLAATDNASEIVTCGYHSVDDYKTMLNTVSPTLESNNVIKHEEMKNVIRKAHVNKFLWFTWRNIYKKELILKNSILFDEEISYGEDNIFNLYAFYNANGIYAIDEPLYYYRNNSNGLSKSKIKPYLNSSVEKEYLRKSQFYKEHGLWKDCKNDLSNYVTFHLLPRMLINAKRSGESINGVLNIPMVKDSLKNSSYSYKATFKTKIMVALAKGKQVKLLNFVINQRT